MISINEYGDCIYKYKPGEHSFDFRASFFEVIDLSDYDKNIRLLNLQDIKTGTLILPNNIDTLPEKFLYGSAIEKIVFPESLETLHCMCLANTKINIVDLSNTKLSRIGIEAFKNSTVREIILPQNPIVASQESFKNCQNLEKINSENIVQIGSFSFANCTKLKEMKINGGIRQSVFFDCNNLESIYFLKNACVYYVDDIITSFTDCKNLKFIYIDENIDKKSKSVFKYLFDDKVLTSDMLTMLVNQNKTFKDINKMLKEDISPEL